MAKCFAIRNMVWIILISSVMLRTLLGCGGQEAEDPAEAPTTQPFQGAAPLLGPAPGTTVPVLPAGCTDMETERDRCKGQTWQICDLRTHLWKDFTQCDSIGQVCSTAPKDCSGLVNTACCVGDTTVPTATPTTTTPTTTTPTMPTSSPAVASVSRGRRVAIRAFRRPIHAPKRPAVPVIRVARVRWTLRTP